ncbi:DUF6196 family protein [Agromyces salentinus]|uniref:DUF6196 family protein n=1 Tax=Agromyces salentinus TaxID=269421 RepID=UPI0012FA5298|nr:DUF6196 family protein [Agromyces salentinus]
MVSVSQETIEQTEQRLHRVIAAADLVALEGVWSFTESALAEPPALTPGVPR